MPRDVTRDRGDCLGTLRDVLSTLCDLAADRQVDIAGWRIAVPDAARRYARLAAAALDRYRRTEPERFSKAV